MCRSPLIWLKEEGGHVWDEKGAIAESVVFLKHFDGLSDPRQRGEVIYRLHEALLVCLLAAPAGA